MTAEDAPIELYDVPMPGAYTALLLQRFGPARRHSPSTPSPLNPGIISVGELLAHIEELERLMGRAWGLQAGSLFDAAAHGPVGAAAMSAPSLAAALDALAEYGHLRSPFLSFSVARRDDARGLVLAASGPLPAGAFRSLAESTLVSVHHLFTRLAGEPLVGARVALSYSPPPWSPTYKEHLPLTAIEFDAPSTAFWLPGHYLTMRSPYADEPMYEASLALLTQVIRRGLAADVLLERVERLVAGSAVGVPSLETMARLMHLSPRTLERRLGALGMTYRELVDTRRRRLADALLADPTLAIGEISHRLGYQDPANFGRACRRWHGVAPRHRRATLLAATA